MGKQFIKDQPKITSGIDPVDWLPEELNWSGFRDAPTGHSKKHCRTLWHINVKPPLSHCKVSNLLHAFYALWLIPSPTLFVGAYLILVALLKALYVQESCAMAWKN